MQTFYSWTVDILCFTALSWTRRFIKPLISISGMVHCWTFVEYYEHCKLNSKFAFGVIKEKKRRRLRRWRIRTAKSRVKGRDTKATVTREKQEEGSEKCKGQYDIVKQQLLKDNFSWLNKDPGVFNCKTEQKQTCWDKQLNPRRSLNDGEYKRENFKRKIVNYNELTIVDNICCRAKQNYVFNWFIATNLKSFKMQKITSMCLNRFI